MIVIVIVPPRVAKIIILVSVNILKQISMLLGGYGRCLIIIGFIIIITITLTASMI